MRIIFYLILMYTFSFNQGLNTNLSFKEKINHEIESINNNTDKDELFIFPLINKNKKSEKFNFLKKYGKNIFLEPLLAFRYSNASFEIDPENTPSNVFWITPGLHLNGQIPLLYNLTSTWIYFWADFYKHSAYGFDGKHIEHGKKLFKYNPLYSMEYYEPVQELFKGIEFDEGKGGIAILSPAFNIVVGKMKANFGPFIRDNLSISNSNPSFQQIRIYKKIINGSKQIHLTYLFGSLFSSIIDSAILNDFYIDNNDNTRRPNVPRYVALHRIDFNIKKNIRIGFYEKIIFGARDLPMEYLNPILPFWSAQHSLGDLDNLIIGFDFTYLIKQLRFVGSFFMDEWDPYNTFNNSKNRNWFGGQFGVSFLPSYFSNKVLLKIECTRLDPRVNNHRFFINYPQHHRYNLGFWTGGHAQDIWISLIYLKDKNSFINISYESTQIGLEDLIKQYTNEDIDFLDGNVKNRNIFSIEYNNIFRKQIDYSLKLKYYDTENLLYRYDSFFETSFSILYNIPY